MLMTECKRDRTPMQATTRGKKAIGLDLVYNDIFLKKTVSLVLSDMLITDYRRVKNKVLF